MNNETIEASPEKFVCYGPDGNPIYVVTPSAPGLYFDGLVVDGSTFKSVAHESDDHLLLQTTYLKDGLVKVRSPRQGAYMHWSVEYESWLPNLDAARAAKLQEVSEELNIRLYLPCNGFDADKVSRDRISGTIARLQRGDGLPAGWMGWRDAANEMHWTNDEPATVLANLCTLSRAIEDREQALLATAWQHKASIAGLEDIDAILSYDVTTDWPT